jgi:hypothetical protein
MLASSVAERVDRATTKCPTGWYRRVSSARSPAAAALSGPNPDRANPDRGLRRGRIPTGVWGRIPTRGLNEELPAWLPHVQGKQRGLIEEINRAVLDAEADAAARAAVAPPAGLPAGPIEIPRKPEAH